MEEDISECVKDHITYNITLTDTCACKGGYYGKYCQYHNEWYPSLNLSVKIFQTIISILVLIWVIIRIFDLRKQKKLSFNLSIVSFMLNVLANVILVSYVWVPTEIFEINDSNVYIIIIFGVILVFSPTILWIAATSMIIGFWFDMLSTELHNKISKRTKIIVITSSISIIVLAVLAMCISLFNIKLVTLTVIMILTPLLLNVVVNVAIVIKIITIDSNNMSHKNFTKKKWASGLLLTICIIWFVVFLLFLSIVLMGIMNANKYSYICSALLALGQGIITILINLLFDYKFRSVQRLFPRLVNFTSTITHNGTITMTRGEDPNTGTGTGTHTGSD